MSIVGKKEEDVDEPACIRASEDKPNTVVRRTCFSLCAQISGIRGIGQHATVFIGRVVASCEDACEEACGDDETVPPPKHKSAEEDEKGEDKVREDKSLQNLLQCTAALDSIASSLQPGKGEEREETEKKKKKTFAVTFSARGRQMGDHWGVLINDEEGKRAIDDFLTKWGDADGDTGDDCGMKRLSVVRGRFDHLVTLEGIHCQIGPFFLATSPYSAKAITFPTATTTDAQ